MLYKLIILYILSRVDFPLSNAQLTAFILEKEYTNYFNIQRAISELLDDEYITVKTIRNSSLYKLTDTGKETLLFFDNLISSGIKEDIEEYLKQNKYQLKEEVSFLADYTQIKKGDFSVRLSVIERDTRLIDLSLSVPTEEDAILICNKWKEKSSDIYAYLMSALLN
jgi:DNA-binding PadR family transcriptional regulator